MDKKLIIVIVTIIVFFNCFNPYNLLTVSFKIIENMIFSIQNYKNIIEKRRYK